jgi:hypothetical protein
MTKPSRTHAYAVGQRVRSISVYHSGKEGTVIRCGGLTSTPAYVVEFAGGAQFVLWETELVVAAARKPKREPKRKPAP